VIRDIVVLHDPRNSDGRVFGFLMETISMTRHDGRGPGGSLTVVCVPVDLFPQNTAPTRCSWGPAPPGIGPLTGLSIGLKYVGNSVSSIVFRSQGRQQPTIRAGDMCLIFTSGLIIGMGYAQGDLAPAPSATPGCRAPTPSKYKQQIGAVFCRNQFIGTQTTVCINPWISVCCMHYGQSSLSIRLLGWRLLMDFT
jgi:hypothetical protein